MMSGLDTSEHTAWPGKYNYHSSYHLPPILYFIKSHNNNLLGKHEVLKMGAALMGLVGFLCYNFQAHPHVKSLLGSPLAAQVLWAS